MDDLCCIKNRLSFSASMSRNRWFASQIWPWVQQQLKFPTRGELGLVIQTRSQLIYFFLWGGGSSFILHNLFPSVLSQRQYELCCLELCNGGKVSAERMEWSTHPSGCLWNSFLLGSEFTPSIHAVEYGRNNHQLRIKCRYDLRSYNSNQAGQCFGRVFDARSP